MPRQRLIHWLRGPGAVLRGLTPRERGEFRRQLLASIKEGADPVGLLIFVGPPVVYCLCLFALPQPTGPLQLALWTLPISLMFIAGWKLVDRRLLRSYLGRVKCPACGGGFTQSRAGALACSEGHWTDVQHLWPARHPPRRLDWKLGRLRVRSDEEFRRHSELAAFPEGEARLLLEQAKTWSSAEIGRALLVGTVLGYVLGAVALAVIAAALLGVLSALGLRSPRHDWMVTTAMVVALLGAVGAGLASARAVARGAVRRAEERRLSTSTCGGCGYSLREIPREADGVRCPECGAFTPFPPAQHSRS